ncbi:eukaryotic translation initiation factor 3 subunit 8 N-terminus-domain-containing protein, partial [Gautieria morchelliformis]
MFRFLRTAGSDDSSSESESADDDESDSDGDAAQPQKKVSRSRRDQEDEREDEDDVKRIVKSAKVKRLEEMEGTGKAIDNALKINHWAAISNEFDKLVRLAQRQTNVAERIPDFYIRTLSGLEDSLNNAMAKEKEAKEKMNLSNSRALNGTKQKVKKINKE